jgi:hypothetical protein
MLTVVAALVATEGSESEGAAFRKSTVAWCDEEGEHSLENDFRPTHYYHCWTS